VNNFPLDGRGRSQSKRPAPPPDIPSNQVGNQFGNKNQNAQRNQNGSGNQDGNANAKSFDVESCLRQMVNFMKEHNLQYIMDNHLSDHDLEEQLRPQAQIASELPSKLPFPVKRELMMQLAIMSLYDMAVLIDDSMSMVFEQGGERREALKKVLAFLASLYGAVSDGTRGVKAIRFLNGTDDLSADNLMSKDEINDVIDNHVFEGLTCMGAGLMRKILKPFVFANETWDKKAPRKLASMERPLLIMVITDGAVEGEPDEWVEKAIRSVVDSLKARGVGKEVTVKVETEDGRIEEEKVFKTKGVVFQFARVGDDEDAETFLKYLDDESSVKAYVDTLSGSDLMDLMTKHEADGTDFSPDDQCRMIKLLLGPIVESYDSVTDNVAGDITNALTGAIQDVADDFDF